MKRILIADDHAIFRQGIKDIITSHLEPVEIAEAKNTQEVIDQAFKTAWDVIILDIDLPGRNGLDAMTEIKRISPKTPVLILSGLAESEFAIRALKAGASGFAPKIAEVDQIIDAINKVSNGGKYISPTTAEQMASQIGTDHKGLPHESLSNRELQVMRLISKGRSTKEIGTELHLSEKTVATYRARIIEKTGLKSSVDMTRYAIQHSL